MKTRFVVDWFLGTPGELLDYLGEIRRQIENGHKKGRGWDFSKQGADPEDRRARTIVADGELGSVPKPPSDSTGNPPEHKEKQGTGDAVLQGGQSGTSTGGASPGAV